MIILTPQATRRITNAVKELPDERALSKWREWVEQSSDTPLNYDVATIALSAIVAESRKLSTELEQGSLDEDSEADILNDLGYLSAIEKSLRLEGVGS